MNRSRWFSKKSIWRMVFVLIAFSGLAAANSGVITYQGTLRQPSGLAVTDGDYAMAFSIFDVDTGGSALWTESHGGVAVADGLFAVSLGATEPFGSLFADNASVWLEIAVDTGDGLEVYGPRAPLSSAPYAKQAESALYAVNAGNAATVEGQDVDALLAAVDSRINAVLSKIVPVGAIVGWHKDLDGVPALPGAWVACNGGTVNDPESPLHNSAIPNLNGENRFLRGGSASGVLQQDQMQGHRHNTNEVEPTIRKGTYQPEPNQGWWAGYPAGQRGGLAQWTQDGGGFQSIYKQDAHSHTVTGPVADTHGTPRVGNETRPTNMSVVWIMRIK